MYTSPLEEWPHCRQTIKYNIGRVIKQKKSVLYEVQQDRFKVTLPLDECKIHGKFTVVLFFYVAKAIATVVYSKKVTDTL